MVIEMVGDPGIEPGTSRLGGVTVRCRTLQHVAHWPGGIQARAGGVKGGSQGQGAPFRLAPVPPVAHLGAEKEAT